MYSDQLPGVLSSIESSALLLRVNISVDIQATDYIVLEASVAPLEFTWSLVV